MRVRVAMDYRPALLTAAGIGRAVRELARALARRDDVELHLFAHSWAAAGHAEPAPAGARLHRWRLPGKALPALARVGVDAARLTGCAEVVHWTDYIHPPVRAAVPVVLTVHDLAFAEDSTFHGAQSDVLLARTRAAAARAAMVLTPTRATAAALARHGIAVPAERLRVVPFGADHVPAPRVERLPADGPLIAVGTVEPRKNYGNLLRALALLPEPRPRLQVFGAPGWECADDIAALEAAERAGTVRWHRRAPDAELFAALAGATALVYPSRLEGFGFPPLEALALGVPVVAGATPALREVLGDAAEFCDPASPASIATALRAVLEDPERRAELRRRGLARAAALRWDACAAAHAAAYQAARDGAAARR